MEKELINNIPEMLNRLDSWVKTNRPDYYQNLLPGASSEEILTFEKNLGIELPEAFKLFLGWKNGQNKAVSKSFIANVGLMSIKEIIQNYEIHNELLEAGDFERANWWDKLWLPFTQDYAGNHWCIDFKGSFGGQPGQIIVFWHDWEARNIIFGSFSAFLYTTLRILEDSGEVSDEFYVPGNYERVQELCRTLNPGYPKEHEAG